MHHFFLNKKTDNKFEIPKEIKHQMDNVLRFSKGEEFIVVYEKKFYLCKKENNFVIFQKELNDNNESNKDITLIVGSLKLKKIELVIQKATELGVNKIIVLQMERSIASYKENFKKKLERWEVITKEAAEQSRRNVLPTIIYLTKIDELKEHLKDNNIVCYEDHDKGETLSMMNNKGSYSVLIGPEGGISVNELGKLKEIGFIIKSLTKTILRAETATFYALSTIINIEEK